MISSREDFVHVIFFYFIINCIVITVVRSSQVTKTINRHAELFCPRKKLQAPGYYFWCSFRLTGGWFSFWSPRECPALQIRMIERSYNILDRLINVLILREREKKFGRPCRRCELRLEGKKSIFDDRIQRNVVHSFRESTYDSPFSASFSHRYRLCL